MQVTKGAYAGLVSYPTAERKLKWAAWIVSAVVLILVGLMRRYKLPVPEGWDVSFLPAVNATINGLTAVALLVSLYFVKQRQYVAHRNTNYIALGLSVLFLACYVTYHFTMPDVKYGDLDGDGMLSVSELNAVGSTRTWYLVLLFSHIALAGIILPFILFTAIRAIVGKYQLHRKMARWVWPLWMYVAITGPVVYLLLRPYY
ncbi:MAG: DUF420 domain-containing protein [Bacteroidota bacterium]